MSTGPDPVSIREYYRRMEQAEERNRRETTPVDNQLTKLEQVAAMIAQGRAANKHNSGNTYGGEALASVETAKILLEYCSAQDGIEKILENPPVQVDQFEIRTKLAELVGLWRDRANGPQMLTTRQAYYHTAAELEEVVKELFNGE